MTFRIRPPFQFSGVFRRIFFHSLLLIVLLFVGMGVLFHLFGPQHNILNVINQLSRTITDQIDFKNKSQAELEAFLRDLHQLTDMSFALIGTDGTVYARAGTHRLSPLDAAETEEIFATRQAGHVDRGTLAFPLKSRTDQPDAYLLVQYKRDTHHLWLLSSLAMVFLLVALVSIPLSRTIARPIEKLTRTATRFARGDLAARTDIRSGDEIGVLARHMDEMAHHLADRIRAEKELLANVSHELKTPLARLKVALALCREDDTVTVQQLQQQLTGIEGDVSELEHLIADVMAVARFDLSENSARNPGLKLRRAPVMPGEIGMASATRFESMGRRQKLSVAVAPDLKEINVDLAMMKRVVDNLLENAAKYSPAESTIFLSVSQTASETRIAVTDGGIGISEEDQARVFEPFYRTDRSRDRGTGGTGLGLTLCKRIVEAHGGTIDVQSDGHSGATFTVSLPE